MENSEFQAAEFSMCVRRLGACATHGPGLGAV